MNKPDTILEIKPRPSEPITIKVPTDVLESLKLEASTRDMSLEALLRLYIGTGLRQDISKRYSQRLLDTTAKVLMQHIGSQSEVTEILREIRSQAIPSAS
jgi:hypothetical protein